MKASLAVMLAVIASVCAAQAQSFPSRPITMVVALPAGGAVDALARVMAEHMRGHARPDHRGREHGRRRRHDLDRRVVRSAPDGYTLGMGTLGQYVISGAVYPLQFDMLADLTPVALLPNVPYWMVGRKTCRRTSLKELVDWLKANPDKASATSVGTGEHGAVLRHGIPEGDRHQLPVRALSRRRAGAQRPGRGAGRPELRSRRQLAVAVPQRQHQGVRGDDQGALVAAPDVPTTDEAGVPGLYYSTWHGSGRRRARPRTSSARSTPRPTRRWPMRRCKSASPRSAWTCRRKDQTTPAAFAAFHKAEVEKWYPIVKAAGVKPDCTAAGGRACRSLPSRLPSPRSPASPVRRRRAFRRSRSP